MTTDDPFDALLGEALAPPARSADGLFVARVQAAVAEAERFRRWRRRALRQVGSEALVLFGLAGAAFTLARIPLAQQLLAGAPFAAPALGGLLVIGWLALALPRPGARLV